MTTALNKGRASIDKVRFIQDTLYNWTLEKGVGAEGAQRVVNCLDESFLLVLPALGDKHYWPQNPGTRNWRYLCQRQIARLLGWSDRVEEGQAGGIPIVVEAFLREKQWPVAHDEPH